MDTGNESGHPSSEGQALTVEDADSTKESSKVSNQAPAVGLASPAPGPGPGHNFCGVGEVCPEERGSGHGALVGHGSGTSASGSHNAGFVSAQYVMSQRQSQGQGELESETEQLQQCMPTMGDAALRGQGQAQGQGVSPKKTLSQNPKQDEELSESCSSVKEPRRKIQMDFVDCIDHANTLQGSLALTNPVLVPKSSKDPNCGLYPRLPKPDPVEEGTSGSFVNARDVYLSGFEAVSRSAASGNHPTRGRGRGSKRILSVPSQSNTLKNYFGASDPNGRHGEQNDGVLKTPPSTPPQSKKLKTTLMFSPLKKSPKGDSIYEVDYAGTNSSSQPCRRACTTGPQGSAAKSELFPSMSQPSESRLPGSRGKVSRSRGQRKEPPKFNRGNAFLYNSDLAKPIPSEFRVKSDKYGLLGTGPDIDSDEEDDYFSHLPLEVIENIFCRLPMVDLQLNVNRVCVTWNDIISDEKFVPWKKRYHALKLGQAKEHEYMMGLLRENKMATKMDVLPQLVRFMKTFKVITSHNMVECLQQHDKYTWAKVLITERLPDCLRPDGEPIPWCVVIVLVMLAEFVADIEQIIHVLMCPTSQCTAMEVIECMYCIATFLLMFKNISFKDVWTGMHYRVFYALYLYENESITTVDQLQDAQEHGKGGQQSLYKYSTSNTKVQMTHEQLRICNHNVGDGDTVKIVAFAGTGKTTTLVRYTQLRPNLRFLLLVYNKSVSEHAKTMFPKNVTCKTGHGLAFGNVGRRYAAKKMLGSSLKITLLLNHFTAIKGESLYVQARFIMETLNCFMASADPFITTAHVPTEKQGDNGFKVPIDHAHRLNYAQQAEKIWEKMVSETNDKLHITHDGYLKVYQLRKPKLYGYDVLLIDEAQDLTPAIADILLSQSQGKILVGDPHQQIYSFRGAVNAMQQVEASHTFYLTQSFRFGPEIAFVAATCLEKLKGERKKTLVGKGSKGSVRGVSEGQVATITRCNFTLFSEAVKICCYSNNPVRVAFVGGTEAFGFAMILDIYALMASGGNDPKGKHVIQNNFLKRFPSFGELERYAIKTMDTELLGKIRIVRTYHNALPSLIKKIRSKCINDPDIADLVLSTAHKAKGLEFPTVRLTDDFNIYPSGNIVMSEQARIDESNILYVAVTRAKKCLQMTPTLLKLLKQAGEDFQYPVLTKKMQGDGVPMKCLLEERDFEPTALTVAKRQIILSDRTVKQPGVLCPRVISEEHASLHKLYGSVKDDSNTDPEKAPDEERMQQNMMFED